VLAARDRVEGLDGCEEIANSQLIALQSRAEHLPWDELGTLVDELVEGVLTVGTALSPDDGLIISQAAVDSNARVNSLQSRSPLGIHPWSRSFRSTPCHPAGSSRRTS
jgi:hypothetical protein